MIYSTYDLLTYQLLINQIKIEYKKVTFQTKQNVNKLNTIAYSAFNTNFDKNQL